MLLVHVNLPNPKKVKCGDDDDGENKKKIVAKWEEQWFQFLDADFFLYTKRSSQHEKCLNLNESICDDWLD